MHDEPKSHRIGIALALLAGWAALLLWVRSGSGWDRQQQVMVTFVVSVATALLLALWAFFLARLSRTARWRLAGVLLAAALLFVIGFRFRGFSGDVAPQFEPRWGGGDAPAPAAAPATPGAGLEAADSPQFLGPQRNGRFPGAAIARSWDGDAPREIWRRPMGKGWSSFAVRDGVAVTLEMVGEGEELAEAVTALDLATGATLWSASSEGSFASPLAGDGPRSTPTLRRGRVFAYGSLGELRALDLETGATLWSVDTRSTHDGAPPEWGHAGSPLWVDGALVVPVGGPRARLAAFEAADGAERWRSEPGPAGYASPALVTLAGVRQIVSFNADSVTGHDPADGSTLWRHPFGGGQPLVAQPMIVGERELVISAGYGLGAEGLRVGVDEAGAWTVERLWKSPRLKAKFTNPVLRDGVLYGLDDGVLTAVRAADGERLWKRGRYGHGQTLLLGDRLLVQTEDGELLLLEIGPEGAEERGRVEVLDGKAWNTPAFAEPYLLVRNDREAVLLDLGAAET